MMELLTGLDKSQVGEVPDAVWETRPNEGGETVKLRVEIIGAKEPTRIRKLEDMTAGLSLKERSTIELVKRYSRGRKYRERG
jgi:hypothetical protein